MTLVKISKIFYVIFPRTCKTMSEGQGLSIKLCTRKRAQALASKVNIRETYKNNSPAKNHVHENSIYSINPLLFLQFHLTASDFTSYLTSLLYPLTYVWPNLIGKSYVYSKFHNTIGKVVSFLDFVLLPPVLCCNKQYALQLNCAQTLFFKMKQRGIDK